MPDIVSNAKDNHVHVMAPLVGKKTNLEIALEYLRQVLKRVPAYEWHLGRAISEIEDAQQGISETQERALEYWKNNYR